MASLVGHSCLPTMSAKRLPIQGLSSSDSGGTACSCPAVPRPWDPVGACQRDLDSGKVLGRAVKLPLATNARAKMQGVLDGFVKLYARPGDRLIEMLSPCHGATDRH